MASVSRQSLNQMIASQRAQFDALRSAGKVSEEIAVLFEGLLAMVHMLATLLLEKRTKKTSANSSLPGLLTPFDQTAPPRPGAKGKGRKHDTHPSVNTRVEIDEQISAVDQCSHCGENLSEVEVQDYERRIKVDIEFVTTETRIDAQIKRCPRCQQVNRGAFPDAMPGPPLQYGSGIVAFATDLIISQMVPLRRSAQMLRQISKTTLLNWWVMRLNKKLAHWEDKATERLLDMPLMHADETSIRANHKNHWIHTTSGADIVVKKCHPKRGAEALDTINIIPRYGARGNDYDEPGPKPVLVHDRWATQMRELLLEACREVAETELKRLTKARFEKVSACYSAILCAGRSELPPRPERKGTKGRLPKSETEKLLDAFVQYKPQILRFAGRTDVPFTNNKAEQDIRMAKVKQKVSGTFRNVNHAHAYCSISSYLQTMSCKGYNSLTAIQITLNQGDGHAWPIEIKLPLIRHINYLSA